MLCYCHQYEYENLFKETPKENLISSIIHLTFGIRKNIYIVVKSLYEDGINFAKVFSRTTYSDDEFSQKKYIFSLISKIRRMIYIRNIFLYALFEFPAVENNAEHLIKIFGFRVSTMDEFIRKIDYEMFSLYRFDMRDYNIFQYPEECCEMIDKYSWSYDKFDYHTFSICHICSPDDVEFCPSVKSCEELAKENVIIAQYNDSDFWFDGLPDVVFRLLDNCEKEISDSNDDKFEEFHNDYSLDDCWEYSDIMLVLCDLIGKIVDSTKRLRELRNNELYGIGYDSKVFSFDDGDLYYYSCFCRETIDLVNVVNRFKQIAKISPSEYMSDNNVDYIVLQKQFNKNVDAYYEQYRSLREHSLNTIIDILCNQTCTTHSVMSQHEAQIFKNDVMSHYTDYLCELENILLNRVQLQFDLKDRYVIKGLGHMTASYYQNYITDQKYNTDEIYDNWDDIINSNDVMLVRLYRQDYETNTDWDIDYQPSTHQLVQNFESFIQDASKLVDTRWEWSKEKHKELYSKLDVINKLAKQDVSVVESFVEHLCLTEDNPLCNPLAEVDDYYTEKDGVRTNYWVCTIKTNTTIDTALTVAKEPYKHPDYKRPASAADPIRNLEDIEKIKEYFLSHGLQKNRARNYTLFCLGISTGLRASDLITLKVEDVFNDNGIVDSIIVKEKKTGKYIHAHLNDEIKSVLFKYIAGFDEINEQDYLFPAKSYLGHLQVYSLYDLFKRVQSDLNLPFHFSTHSLRKTFAYWTIRMHYYDQNIIFSLQDMLNHRDIKNTLYYSGHTKDHLKTLYDDMGKVLTGNVEDTPAISSQEQKINQILDMLSKQLGDNQNTEE